MIRVVITHPEMGVYLGCSMGFGFWTLLDPVGQPVACTFPSFEDASQHVKTWQPPAPINDFNLVALECRHDRFATIPELKAAGLEHMLGVMELDALRYATPAGHA